ncbi:MAG: RNA methyltransferase [Chloroflexota bacterium]
MITSAQNPKLKLVRLLLGRPKERQEAGAFVAEGVRLVEEALAADWPFRFILHTDDLSVRGRDLVKNLTTKGVQTEEVPARLLDTLSDTGNTQGIIAVLDHSTLPIPHSLDFVLIPDQIRDPGNLGTLLRSAAAAGAQAVFLPPETTDAFAPKVVRAGMGAHFRLPIQALNWDEIRARTLRQAQGKASGLRIYLADMHGLPCWETDLRLPLALIIGGEAEGASAQARDLATASISIPMPGGSESLNASAAGAILMFEVLRQRQKDRHYPY